MLLPVEPYKIVRPNKATLQQIRNGDAPPVWSVNVPPSKRFGVDRACLHEGLCL